MYTKQTNKKHPHIIKHPGVGLSIKKEYTILYRFRDVCLSDKNLRERVCIFKNYSYVSMPMNKNNMGVDTE